MSSAGKQILSLLFFLNVPVRAFILNDCGAISSPTIPCSLLSGVQTRSPESAGDRSRARWRQSKFTLSFHLCSSFLSTTSFLFGTWGSQASPELGTFVLSFLFIRSSACEYHWKVELICMLEVQDTVRWLSSVKLSQSLILIQPLHYSLDSTGCWLHGETDTISRTYGNDQMQGINLTRLSLARNAFIASNERV